MDLDMNNQDLNHTKNQEDQATLIDQTKETKLQQNQEIEVKFDSVSNQPSTRQLEEIGKQLLSENQILTAQESEIPIESPQIKQSQPVIKNQDSLNVQEYLENQLLKYQKIEQNSDSLKDKQVLKKIINTLESQLDKLKFNNVEPITNDVSNFGGISLIKELEQSQESFYQIPKIEKHLKEIYKFYSKIYYVRGPSDDFGRINHESHTLSEGKFIIFCRQFHLIDEKLLHQKPHTNSVDTYKTLNDTINTKSIKPYPNKNGNQQVENYRILQFKELNLLFRKVNENKNEISFYNFVKLLQELAKIMFSNDQSKSEQLLYQLLEIDTTQFRNKMKSINIPFNSKEIQGYRKPEGLSIQRKYNQSTDQIRNKKQQIEEWRNSKRIELNFKLNNETFKQQIWKSMFEPSYSKTNNYSERKIKQLGLQSNANSIINWEKLDKLDPKYLLNDNFKPEDLIDEDRDDEDKFYLKSYDISLTDQQKKNSSKSTSKIQQFKTESQRDMRSNNNNKISLSGAYIKLPKLK